MPPENTAYIPFNKPFLSGNEMEYIKQAVLNGKISGDGHFTRQCHDFFEKRYGFKRALLTTSCTDALEMSAILADIKPGDEVIMPSFTFVSTANAFLLRGAKVKFADSLRDHPNIDPDSIRKLVTRNTKAIVPVHYAGAACDMDSIMSIASEHNLFVIEDAALALESSYKGRPVGSFGAMSAFSFHETKNVICGEGGLLAINDERFIHRAEIIREKGTNRSAFSRGEIDKYNWVDIGSSFLPSDIIAAFLYAQLEQIQSIQEKRVNQWNTYNELLKPLGNEQYIQLPQLPGGSSNSGHIFYILCRSLDERTSLIRFLDNHKIRAAFHYLPLHLSPYFSNEQKSHLPNATEFGDRLVRLPLYHELTFEDQLRIAEALYAFYTRS